MSGQATISRHRSMTGRPAGSIPGGSTQAGSVLAGSVLAGSVSGGGIDRRRLLAGLLAAPLAGTAMAVLAPGGRDAAAATDPAGGASRYPDLIGELKVHKIVGKQTLVELAVDYDVGYTELITANPGIDPWLPGDGTAVVLPTAHILPDAPQDGMVINLAEQRLYYFPRGGEAVRTYPIGIGRDGLQTPMGRTKVVRKKAGPTWRPTRRMREEDPTLPAVVPPGPDNPLGSHALYLGWPQYLIHGTNKPYGIGRRVSSGCIRLYPDAVAELHNQVPVGTPVTVVDQPMKIGWSGGEMFLEVHPSQTQADQIESDGAFQPEEIENFVLTVVEASGGDVGRLDWPTITRAANLRTGVPVQVTWTEYAEPSLDSDQLLARPAVSPRRSPGARTGVTPAASRPSSRAPIPLMPDQ